MRVHVSPLRHSLVNIKYSTSIVIGYVVYGYLVVVAHAVPVTAVTVISAVTQTYTVSVLIYAHLSTFIVPVRVVLVPLITPAVVYSSVVAILVTSPLCGME